MHMRVKIGKSRRTRSTSSTVGAREETAVGMGVIGLFPPEVSSHEDGGNKPVMRAPTVSTVNSCSYIMGNVIDRHVRCWARASMARSCVELSPGCVDEENLFMCRFLPV